jgi:hypothetical protein
MKSMNMAWDGYVAHMKEMRNSYTIFVRKSEYNSLNWIHFSQDRGPVAGCCENGNETSGSTEGW